MAKPLKHSDPAAPAPSTIAVERPQAGLNTMATLMRLGEASGLAPMKLVRDFANLSFGPGKVSLDDYSRLRLFDEAFWAGADRRAVAGRRRACEVLVEANYRQDWYGLVDNKIASASYLGAYGLPVISTMALFADGLATPTVLRTADDLRAFLTQRAEYPIFGKPAGGMQSLGSAAFCGVDAAEGVLRGMDGESVSIDRFVAEVTQHYGAGYLFQPLLTPHADVAALTGGRIGTVRILTLNDGDGPRVFRACWKLPAGGNMADNYWRSGNLLAQIDSASGTILSAMRGVGVDLAAVERHPDSGAALVGAKVPGWEALQATALEGARLMRHVAVIGWDMAATAAGPVIVEMNHSPDVALNQLADRRGILEPGFLAFVEAQRRAAAAFAEQNKLVIARL